MPRATVTSRELKNKDSGLDLFVPSYHETKGMVMSTVHYQVVLVSNLACFKTPSHKESDVVQYSIEKKMAEFEEMRTKVSEVFPGTLLPPISKKSLIVNDVVLRERRNSLDHFLKFLASTPKLATCPPLLEFLGVDALRAKKFSLGESLEGTPAPDAQDDSQGDEAEASGNIFFDDGNDEGVEADLFDEGDNFHSDDNIFKSSVRGEAVQVQMFEEQDLKRELTEEDEKDFRFIPDAIITKREKITVFEDDNSDLFQIEDDLDKLMTVDVGKKTGRGNKDSSLSSPASEAVAKPTIPAKPTLPSKPTTAAKPTLPSKPKPGQRSSESSENTPGREQSKPTPAPKPKPAARSKPDKQDSGNPDSASGGIPTSAKIAPLGKPSESIFDAASVENLGQDDIMKYLQDNLSSNTDDVDLFS